MVMIRVSIDRETSTIMAKLFNVACHQDLWVSISNLCYLHPAIVYPSYWDSTSADSSLVIQPWPSNPQPDWKGQYLVSHPSADKAGCPHRNNDTSACNSILVWLIHETVLKHSAFLKTHLAESEKKECLGNLKEKDFCKILPSFPCSIKVLLPMITHHQLS